MQCPTCQYELPPGVTFCPNCGTPVRASSSPNQGIPPTVAATPPDQGIPPTVAAAPYTPPPPPGPPYGVPTNYGENPPPPPQSYDPTPPPYGAYGAPQQAPYGAPPYTAPPPQTPYGAPPPPQYVQPQQPKKNNGCVIAVVIVLVVFVLVVGGIIAAVAVFANKAGQTIATVGTNINATATSIAATATSDEATANSGLTPTTGTTASVPDPSQIDPTAHANITGAQTSAGMDSNYKPTHPTTSFTSGTEVDITFTLAGNAGYATAKIYGDGQFIAQPSTPLTVASGDMNGYFSYTPDVAGQYVAGLYWCKQSDCSDAALAQVVTFTVS